MPRHKVIRKAPLPHYETPREVEQALDARELDDQPGQPIPPDWSKGALLNVRNGGDAYLITLYPEEYDHRHPERCLRFTNVGECQLFVSTWYMRQSQNPLAR